MKIYLRDKTTIKVSQEEADILSEELMNAKPTYPTNFLRLRVEGRTKMVANINDIICIK